LRSEWGNTLAANPKNPPNSTISKVFRSSHKKPFRFSDEENFLSAANNLPVGFNGKNLSCDSCFFLFNLPEPEMDRIKMLDGGNLQEKTIGWKQQRNPGNLAIPGKNFVLGKVRSDIWLSPFSSSMFSRLKFQC
jgi:hypothetical protein